MTVLEIVKKYLEDNRIDGLCYTETECGCDVSDLAPCDCITLECQTAKKIMCKSEDCSDCEFCCPGIDERAWRMEPLP